MIYVGNQKAGNACSSTAIYIKHSERLFFAEGEKKKTDLDLGVDCGVVVLVVDVVTDADEFLLLVTARDQSHRHAHKVRRRNRCRVRRFCSTWEGRQNGGGGVGQGGKRRGGGEGGEVRRWYHGIEQAERRGEGGNDRPVHHITPNQRLPGIYNASF